MGRVIEELQKLLGSGRVFDSVWAKLQRPSYIRDPQLPPWSLGGFTHAQVEEAKIELDRWSKVDIEGIPHLSRMMEAVDVMRAAATVAQRGERPEGRALEVAMQAERAQKG